MHDGLDGVYRRAAACGRARRHRQRRREAKGRARATLAATPQAKPREFRSPAAGYIEAHIEQGPLLENARKTIGVVTGIQGLRWFNVEVFGKTDHAGTTPLALRKDAVRDSIAIINALTELTQRCRRRHPLHGRPHAGHAEFAQFSREPCAVLRGYPSSRSRHDRAAGRSGRAARTQGGAFCDVKVTPTLHDDPCVFDRRCRGRNRICGADARPAAHAPLIGRKPRCDVHGARVSDRNDIRAVRKRHIAQRSGKRDARRISPPARAC